MNNAPRIIALETSGRLGSVAVAQGPQLLHEQPFSARLRHAGELLPTMADLVQRAGWTPADLDQLYLSIGPGSFTGLRIAVAVAKTLSLAVPSLRVVAVPSLDVRAMQAHRAHRPDLQNLAVAIDAKKRQVYAALYKSASDDGRAFVPGLSRLTEPAVLPPSELLAAAPRPLYVIGAGLEPYSDVFRGDDILLLEDEFSQPCAADVHRCGWRHALAGKFAQPESLEPCYLRRPEAVERWETLHPEDRS